VNEYQLDSFIQLQEGATTVTTAALSHADVVSLREAHRTGAFVQARTNMSVGYAVLGVSATRSVRDPDGQEHQTFNLVYSGEPEDSSRA
jgi:hypothetical protein